MTPTIRLVARIGLAAKDEYEAREVLQKLLSSESTIERAAITVGDSPLGSGDYGGRDLTYPDGSEGGYWVEPQGYTVKVDVPNNAMLELVLESLHNLRLRAPMRRVRRNTAPRRVYTGTVNGVKQYRVEDA